MNTISETIPVGETLDRLAEHYPHPALGLNFKSPWQLLIATILAAQARDSRINELTPVLFKAYPGPEELADAPLEDIEKLIMKSGTFHQKARRIKDTAVVVAEKHGGKVPQDFDELTALPGVARKTANVIMSNAFGKPVGIVVDTHVLRVGFRTGMSTANDAAKAEKQLMKIIPQKQWGTFENRLKVHGQRVCVGGRPHCDHCFLSDLCPKHPYKKK